jgi:hypothetical protein
MGVDAHIYARKARKKFYFDRIHNIRHAELPGVGLETFDAMRGAPPQRTCTSKEVRLLALVAKVLWLGDKDESQRRRANVCDAVGAFAAAFPDDEFFVVETSVMDEGLEGDDFEDWES